jgi:hypothetical protein
MNWKGYNLSRNREFVIHKFTSSNTAHNLSKNTWQIRKMSSMSLKDALKVYKLNYNRCLDGEQKEQKDTLDTILLLPNFHPLVFNLILRRINLEIKRSGA